MATRQHIQIQHCVQHFIEECIFMHALLEEREPLANLEYQLIDIHLKQLTTELYKKASQQRH